MARVLSKEWANRKPFTRRVRWYCRDLYSHEGRSTDIRLTFDDETGRAYRVYGTNAQGAVSAWSRFKDGLLTTEMLRNGKQ